MTDVPIIALQNPNLLTSSSDNFIILIVPLIMTMFICMFAMIALVPKLIKRDRIVTKVFICLSVIVAVGVSIIICDIWKSKNSLELLNPDDFVTETRPIVASTARYSNTSGTLYIFYVQSDSDNYEFMYLSNNMLYRYFNKIGKVEFIHYNNMYVVPPWTVESAENMLVDSQNR